MEFPVLETERLSLRQITHKNVDEIFSIFSNEEVIKYYGMDPFTEKDQAVKMIDSFQTRFENLQGMRFGIVEKESKKLIGTIGLNNLVLHSRRTEIGYDLLPEFWRKGYMSEAIKEITSYCFEKLGIFRIGANIFPDNTASSTLVEKVGFKKEGLLRGYLVQNDQSYDLNVFSLIKPDWEKY
ncbi:GNAT family N-acetyltransferase [Bacillus sp. AFS041924]|uniref:GNAT family N-acetyltransferase n=1 Tax=Bacillus sp. AFS041924 TaxID=2033503 RepID=UPI000BFCE5A4|nr:GNAT family protein [Bacillus sp. AFS041924]PGS53481.1 GNAT family N-acetyltransferase [Bacillus sp. AFS041924]